MKFFKDYKSFLFQTHSQSSFYSPYDSRFRALGAGLIALFSGFILASISHSQVVTTSITPDLTPHGSLGTIVTPNGTIHDITGGMRPDEGANLFHSFERFNLGTGETASFNGPSGIENILSRVTGGTRSDIDGTLQSTIDGANLFFMNPAGIVFGPNASLDVSGSFHVSTSDYLRLGEGENAGHFSATNLSNDILTTAPPTAFGFLGINPLGNTAAARIMIDGTNSTVSQLTVPGLGNVLSIIGRDAEVSGQIAPGVDVRASRLESKNGRVNLASVGSHQSTEVGLTEGLEVKGQSAPLGAIRLTAQTQVNSGIPPELTISDIPDLVNTEPRLNQPTGPIVIRGGQLVMENSFLVANTANGKGSVIDIQMFSEDSQQSNLMGSSGSLASGIFLKEGSGISADILGSGSTSNIVLAGEMVSISGGTQVSNSTFSEQPGGTVLINATDSVTIEGRDDIGNPSRVVTASLLNGNQDTGEVFGDSGRAGNIMIATNNFRMSNGEISAATEYDGSGGNVLVSSRNSVIEEGAFIFIDTFFGSGDGGTIILTATESLIVTGVDPISGSPTRIASGSLFGTGDAGNITLSATDLTVTNGADITTSTFAEGDAGSIMLKGDRVHITNGSLINNSTFFNVGDAGNISVIGDESIALTGQTPEGFPSIIASASAAGASGDSGSILLESPKMTFTDEAQVFTTSQGVGDAGSVTLQVDQLTLNDNVLLASSNTSMEDISGNGGAVTIKGFEDSDSLLASLSFTDSVIRTNANAGTGGTLSISSSGNIQVSGTSISACVLDGSQSGGSIIIEAGPTGTLSLVNGTDISTQSEGQGNAGSVSVSAGDTIFLQDAKISASATQASGGNITLDALEMIQLIDSTIETKVLGNASTEGGNISLDPRSIILQNSQLLATATFGGGGNIDLIADVILADPFSSQNINASSDFGISGSVNLQAPIQNLSESIAPLPEDLIAIAQFYASRCFAQKGGNLSSFVYHQVPSLPIQPGDFMNSQMVWGGGDVQSVFSGKALLPSIVRSGENESPRIFDLQTRRFSSLGFSPVIQGC